MTLQSSQISKEKVSSYGLIKLTTVKETRPYVITAAVDPRSDETVGVSVAQERGILSADSSTYYDTLLKMNIPILDAIDVGLVIVEYDACAQVEAEPEIESKTYAVHGVVDRKHQRRLSFAEAVKMGILDKEQGVYRDNANNKDMHVGEAIMRGLVKARKVEDEATLEIDPENKIVVERFDKAWSKLKALSAFGGLKNLKLK